jgi:protocatechuate 4,5-dioxygenase beta chain
VPLEVNTVQHPLPTPARCYKLGKALGRAIRSYPDGLRVVVIGTGGMSHQLQGERAGFINKPFDLMFMDTITKQPEILARYSIADLVAAAGSEGVELIMWLVMRGAMADKVAAIHTHYHTPISSTGAGVLVLEDAA